jgi:hypothetical protein
MDLGLGFLGYDGCWDDAAFAEHHRFETAGFVDSPLLAGDPYVCLGLAARATQRIRIGTFLSIPSLRPAAVTASALATVDRVARGGRSSASPPATPAARRSDSAPWPRRSCATTRSTAATCSPAGP